MNEIEVIGGLAMHNSWVMLAGAAMLWLAWMARWRRCSCPNCAHHRDEDRRAREEAVARAHDREHEGFDWTTGEKVRDKWNCHDKACPRNKDVEH